ncbi:hypothetical protein BN1723_015643 [Verticillium longisporum]|uniref:Extracellular membrane protein CFEM domain-containing protein n=1 Tax=Verticillium longisporum TaxID=100787 RepID=A0A0G4N124_VERLO|nr:hypothetical protein BN1723_015643 [Verticillium longisporum]
MRASIPPLLTLALLARAQNSDRPRCVATCIANDLMASQCDGDEQGAALDECTCVTLSGSPMIACIRDCAPADQGRYAAQLPELCHDRLLPNAEGASGGGGGDDDDDQTTTTRLLFLLLLPLLLPRLPLGATRLRGRMLPRGRRRRRLPVWGRRCPLRWPRDCSPRCSFERHP